MQRSHLALIISFFFTPTFLFAQSSGKRAIAIDDVYRIQKIGNPQISPDGAWIAYTVTSIDKDADKRRTALWMVNWEGTQNVRLTFGKESAGSPSWSPEGKYVSYLAAEGEGKKSQIWLLDRRGGGPQQLTNVKGDIDRYRWSPDGKRIVVEMSEDDTDANSEKRGDGQSKAPKPIVLDRYHFKHDIDGYITAAARVHLFLFDLETKKLEALTANKEYEDSGAEWSPDGKRIAFLSNHEKDPDRSPNNEIYVVEARAGATPQKVTSGFSAGGQQLSWSPDGKLISFLIGSEAKYSAYNMNRLAVVPVTGGTPRVLTDKFDRGISSPKFTRDGSVIECLVPDDRSAYLASVSIADGKLERLVKGELVVHAKSSAAGHTALDLSTDTSPCRLPTRQA
jgi:Tol biopolymer transport system component